MVVHDHQPSPFRRAARPQLVSRNPALADPWPSSPWLTLHPRPADPRPSRSSSPSRRMGIRTTGSSRWSTGWKTTPRRSRGRTGRRARGPPRRPASGSARRRQASVTACARVVYIGFSVAGSPDGTPRLLRGGRSKPKSRQLAARTATAVARHVLLTSGPLPVSPRCDPCLSPGVGSAGALSCASAWLTGGRQLLHCQLVYVPTTVWAVRRPAPTERKLLPTPLTCHRQSSSCLSV